MSISRSSTRIQFTLNESKEKEKIIAEFLDNCMNTNNTIKEILYNYIVSNSDTKLVKVTHSEVTQSKSKSVKVNESELVKNNTVSNSEPKLVEVSDLESNEIEELKKFM